jgi:molybdopterin converting factor small subunit
MIEVRLYANLAPAGRPLAHLPGGVAGFEIEARDGLTVGDVVAEAGIRPEDVAVMLINHDNGTLESALADGDRLGLFPAVSGG